MRRPYVNRHYPAAAFALDCLACLAGFILACAIAYGAAYVAFHYAAHIATAQYAVACFIALASAFSIAVGCAAFALLAFRDCYGHRYIRRYTLLR